MAAGSELPDDLIARGFTLPPPKIILANISPGTIRTRMASGVLDAVLTGTAGYGCAFVESGPYLDQARNRAVATCLSTPSWEWMVFVDSDIEFTAAHLRTLLLPTRHVDYLPQFHSIIGGVYVNPYPDDGIPGEEDDELGSHLGPVACEWLLRDDLDGMKLNAPPVFAFRRLSRSALDDLPGVDAEWNLESRVTQVAAVGTGFMAIHRSLLNTFANMFPPPTAWFDEPVVNTVHLGEDYAFCHRATSLGYPVLVNRACHVMHHHTLQLI